MRNREGMTTLKLYKIMFLQLFKYRNFEIIVKIINLQKHYFSKQQKKFQFFPEKRIHVNRKDQVLWSTSS